MQFFLNNLAYISLRSAIHRNRSCLSPNYIIVSNKLHYSEEFIVNIVIRQYKYVKNIVIATEGQAWPEHLVCSYFIEFTALICTLLEHGHASSVEHGLLYLCSSKTTCRTPSSQGSSSSMKFLVWLCVHIFECSWWELASY